MMQKLPNPKRRTVPDASRSHWYRYYAGYSDDFVLDVLRGLELPVGAKILDPWNGSGTTTELAGNLGYEAIGLDINPVMVLVAKARLLDDRAHGSLNKIGTNIALRARALRRHIVGDRDPLTAWLHPDSAAFVRAYDHALQELLVDGESYRRLYSASLTTISSLAAFYYVVLFRTLRMFLGAFSTSNPTWIKSAKVDAERIRISTEGWEEAFTAHVELMERLLAREPEPRSTIRPTCHLDVACSEALPLSDSTIDAVVTSPPYCTRIDYVVATRPELALLGCTKIEQDELRKRMSGTPTMSHVKIGLGSPWGAACTEWLSAVSRHHSRASSTYYRRYYLQYFNSVFTSLQEIDRVLTTRGTAVFVVQDSYYKELRIDLAKIFSEMGTSLGWSVAAQHDYPVTSNLASINPRSRQYRPSSEAVESVVVLRKSIVTATK